MKIITLISSICFVLCVSSTIYASDTECMDDKRLSQLHSLLANPSSIDPPLELTAEKFASMDPEVAREISPYLRICPGVSVANGIPSRRLSVDFTFLLQHIDICYRNHDWDCIKRLKQLFTAKPLSVEEVHANLGQFHGKVDDRKLLARTLHMDIKDGVVLYTDVFYAFGGKITHNGKPIQSDYIAFLVAKNPKDCEVQEIYDGYHGNIAYIYANCFYFTAIANSLRKLGFVVHDSSDRFGDSCSTHYKTAIEEAKKWLTQN